MLGSLVEKALSTPQQYPLTLSALVAACNQTSNREPVVSYDEQTVQAALHELKDLRLVRFVLPSHGRSVVRYRQVLDENLGLDARQSAVLAVLLLRGPQTVGELRLRTERMSRFDGLDEVQHELDLLGARDEPLAANVGRRPGQKEERWATLLVGTPDAGPFPDERRHRGRHVRRPRRRGRPAARPPPKGPRPGGRAAIRGGRPTRRGGRAAARPRRAADQPGGLKGAGHSGVT